ncbi:MAG: site-2 protease family protein [Candidatus Thermoplasmatota archaeon]|nr:site-2 protease family protein [Candidatus Thermoplasmatota archaeon]MBU4070911.1 site-2 protease family protein [Candidatus Thermoplasmatota archaeon]MBU4144950.1 site-2 protease family protein [Candidatus Thermoplasmatota archaeon]MBU4591705.1 site-2 protease family protein [Candidatus Thermoplasmatota archaeon]
MDMIYWYLLALGIILLWTVAVSIVWGRWKEQIEKKSIQCMGPFVMWKTQRGKQLIEKIATTRVKLVETYGRISVGITGVSMVTMTALLVFSAYLVIERAKDIDIELHMLLGLPGLNPMIPLWYGILGLIVAMVVHEFSHGLLTIVAKVKVVSLGIMFFIFPMGAFVEPDEKGIMTLEKKKRVRMYSAGPASNIIVAGVFSVIFSVILMSSVQPVAQGIGITGVGDGTAADIGGLVPGMIITTFNGTPILRQSDFTNAIALTSANQNVSIEVYDPNIGGDGMRVLPNVTLTDKFLETGKIADEGKGYLGINSMTVRDDYFKPIGDSRTLGDMGVSVSIYITLPLQRLSPVDGVVMGFYEIDGFWSFMPTGAFWILANACYWIFWLNLMVGLSNALPAVPLDGGYIFKDWLDSFMGRISRFQDVEKRTKIVDTIALVLAFTILFLILWQVIGPRVL